MTPIHLSIGGVLVRVEPDSPAPVGLVGERLGSFVVEDGRRDPDVHLVWRDGDPTEIALGELLYYPGAIWRMHRSADHSGYVIVVAYSDDGHVTPKASVLETDPGWSRMRLTERASGPPWSSLLNLGVGELIVRTRVILDGGLVFHAAAVDDSGRGILMVGHSGAGKSTQSLIWQQVPGATVLSDDRIAVRVEPDRVAAYGTPWGGTADIARNGSVALRTILVLEQSPVNEVIRLSPVQAMPLLLVRSFLPYWDGSLMATAAETVERILQRVPVYVFRCRPDESVIEVVRGIL